METLEAIFTRRSIRKYTSQTIPDELVEKLLLAAMQAPSAGNQQPWHFIVVTDRAQMDSLADALPFGKMLHTAPLGIAVCADVESARYSDYWVQDCSAATQNLLLAAHALGLGAVWLGVYPLEERVAGVKQILGLPAPVIPLNIISLGYPVSPPAPVERRYNETRLHYNHW
jgi:nitroreductase